MEITLQITIPDELVNLIIKEFELANSGKESGKKVDELKIKLVENISEKLKLKVSKDLQTKIKNLFLNSKA